jgi:EpsI family protein
MSSVTKLSSRSRILLLLSCLILILQAAASRALSVEERDVPIPELRKLPLEIGGWRASEEQTLDSSVEEYLKPNDYILRNYVNQEPGVPINLFVAYFKSLQNSYGPHSPRVCLPGSGWLTRSSQIAVVAVPGRASGIPVNEYVLEKSGENILVMYWYQNDRNVWAEEFRAKLTLLPDLLAYRRSDVSLVRLVAPLGGRPDVARMSSTAFTKLIFPLLVERFRITGGTTPVS